MPIFLLGLAMKLGIPARFAKYAVFAAGAVLLLLAVFAAVKIHDHRVIATHEAKQDAANAKADRQADAKAAEQRRSDDVRVTTETQEINNAVSEAKRTGADPRAAYYKCVRAQQAARRAGKPSTGC